MAHITWYQLAKYTSLASAIIAPLIVSIFRLQLGFREANNKTHRTLITVSSHRLYSTMSVFTKIIYTLISFVYTLYYY